MQSKESLSASTANPNAQGAEANISPASSGGLPRRDLRFWLIILSIALSLFVAALELSGVSTALPIIVEELHGSQFVWVGSAYALAATAFLPTSGGLAQIFGRRPIMLGSLLTFAAGSAACGAAPNMNALIIGRTIQGLGGGGIFSLTQIILSDLVPLRERGMFNGLIGVAWALASAVGPVVGGSLAQHGHWRWLFYLNIPVCGVAGVLVFTFLRFRTPTGSLREKLGQMDWIGNILVIAGSTACMIALTWGGVQYPWSSFHVLVPLILGLVGLAVFVAYDAKIAEYPIVPFSLLSAATSVSGYLQTFIMPIALLGFIYYMPVYFQACQGASPTASGIDGFGFALTIAPMGIISGLSVAISHQYRPQLWLSWVLVMIGAGLLRTITADSFRMTTIGYSIVLASGLGMLGATTYFPVLAPVPVSENAKALAFFTFCRNFAQVWGVTIGGSVLQNELVHRLPSEFVSVFPEGTAIAYAVIPLIPTMEQPLKDEVRKAFAGAVSVIWTVLIGIGGLGLLSSLPMKRLPLHTDMDEDWGMESERREPKV